MTAKGRGAVVFGVDGPDLAPDEAAFFRDADPFGFILFARNVDTPDRLRRLTDRLRTTVGRDAAIIVDQEGGRVQRLREPHWTEWLPPLDAVARAGGGATRMMWLRGRLIAAELHGVGGILDLSARKLVPFEEAYEKTDWSKYRDMPAFDEANRINAYNQYLRLEQESGE